LCHSPRKLLGGIPIALAVEPFKASGGVPLSPKCSAVSVRRKRGEYLGFVLREEPDYGFGSFWPGDLECLPRNLDVKASISGPVQEV
jgi:hypothetical protein